MTAAKVMEANAKPPRCARHAADAISAYTQIKMEDAPSLLKIPKSECPDIWIRLPKHERPKSWSNMEDPTQSFLLSEICTVILWQDCYGKKQFEKFLVEHGWRKIPNWECLFVNREERRFLSVYVDDIKLAWKQQNIDPMWTILVKKVDLGEPTSFFDHVYLGCTQRECETNKDIEGNYRNMFESKISARAKEKLLFSRKLDAIISSWSCDMENHAKKCVERYCELANKTTQQLYKYNNSMPWWPLNTKKKKWDLLENCQKCLYLARMRRPDILWSVNKLSRAITI